MNMSNVLAALDDAITAFPGRRIRPIATMSACMLIASCVASMAAETIRASTNTYQTTKTYQAKTCRPWDITLHRMLDESEQFGIHTPELRAVVRAEALRLKDRCLRDISSASLNRYILLTKMLYDDEADEVESFE